MEDVRKEITRLVRGNRRVTDWRLFPHSVPGLDPAWVLWVSLGRRLTVIAAEYIPAEDDPRTAEQFARTLWDRTLENAEGWCGQ